MNACHFALLLSLMLFVTAGAAPPLEEIVERAIVAAERQDSVCSTYTTRVHSRSIKYDKHMQPEEVTTMMKLVYHSGNREAEQIFSIDKDGKLLSAEEAAKKVRDKNEEWREAQKHPDKLKKGSRNNFVDPLTRVGRPQYSFFFVAEHDSAIRFDTAAVAGARDGDIIDQSVQKLRTHYVIQARPLKPGECYPNVTYWIDGETSEVMRAVFAPSEMPAFVDTLHFELDYTPQEIGGTLLFLPKRFEVMGRAGFLIFKGRFGLIEEFSDYRCNEAIDESWFATRYWYQRPEEGQ